MALIVSEDESISHYRSISWAAILAMALALASSLAIANPLFLAVALAAFAAALLALRQIAANSENIKGRGLALAALFLAVFFLVLAPSRLWMRSRIVQQNGQELAEAFLDLLQEGDFQEAFQLAQIKYITPSPDQTMIPGFDHTKLTPADFREFEQTQTIRSIKQIDHKFSYRLETAEAGRIYTDGELLVLRYRIDPESRAAKKSFPIWISVSRSVEPKTGMPSWRITDVQHVLKKQ